TPRTRYRDVGILFQDHGVVGELTPLENVLCGRLLDYPAAGGLVRFRAEDRRRAAALLADLGLAERSGLRTAKLSGGEQQRVGIARLLLQDPAVLLLDEPLASLDVHWAAHALARMRAARGGRATVVAVLHDLTLVRRWADRVLLIQDGVLVFDGAPEEACQRLERLEPGAIDSGPAPASRGAEVGPYDDAPPSVAAATSRATAGDPLATATRPALGR